MDERYQACVDVLMNEAEGGGGGAIRAQLASIVNKKDELGNTALHYAVRLWPQAVVLQLLNLGANIGVANLRGDIPLSRILPATLETFLDEGRTSHSGHPMNEDFSVEFDYSFLAPPLDDDKDLLDNEWSEERQEALEKVALPETQSLWCMARSPHHRHLLKHPVVSSFLWLKWQRIRPVFNRNIRFYAMFVVSLTWYIFARFGGVHLNSCSVSNNETISDSCNISTVCQHLPL